MDYDNNLASDILRLVAPDGIWTLGKTSQQLLSGSLRRLPNKDVSETERRYPTTHEGLRAFMNGFFARHYFQAQDSLIQYFASPAFGQVVQRGVMHVADVGCGPAVASIAIAELAGATLAAMNKTDRLSGRGGLRIHFALNDTSDVCLNEGVDLLRKCNDIESGRVSIGRILPLSTPFPKSTSHFHRVARMTTPYDVCCLGYVVVPLSEQIGVEGIADAISKLAQAGNSDGGRLILTQDKFQEDLHRRVCRALGVTAEMGELKQKVYDTNNQNAEHTYTYCRSCSPMSNVATMSEATEVN